MNSLPICAAIFTCVFGGALLGFVLRPILPEHHLSSDSKDTMKLGLGLIGTMAALVLGLMVSTAKTSYDTQRSEVTQMSAKVIVLDRVLARYGSETKKTRDLLTRTVFNTLHRMWPDDRSHSAQLDPTASDEVLSDQIHELTPKTDLQRALQSQALSIAMELGQTRWLLFEQSGSSISTPFLVVLVVWLTIIFLGFGLFAPRNMTVVVTLLLCALSVSGAIFLILELDQAFDGMIRIPSDALRNASAQLGR